MSSESEDLQAFLLQMASASEDRAIEREWLALTDRLDLGEVDEVTWSSFRVGYSLAMRNAFRAVRELVRRRVGVE